VRRLLTLGLLVLGSGSCTCGKSGEALEVEVTFSGLHPACLEVQVRDEEDGSRTGSATVQVTDVRRYVVGVSRATGWSKTWAVSVLARESSCTGSVVAREDRAGVVLADGVVTTATFALSGVDADGDGYSPASSGGGDCDDSDPLKNPGAPELCGNGADDDCDGQPDCADLGCLGSTCDDANGCTSIDVCTVSGCAGTAVSCGAPQVECRQATGTCASDAGCTWPFAAVGAPCDGGLCTNGGACAPADTELDCANGIDDLSDLDTLADCADPDCFSVLAPCDAGLCVLGAACQSNQTCVGTPKSCAPTMACRDAGVCDPGTGSCSTPLSPAGSSCDDGNGCTTDLCNAGGACQGTAMVCTAPNACSSSACDAGVCVVSAANNGGACDDDAGCTHSDLCAGGSCGGTAYTCAAPPSCYQPGVCLGDGGCGFSLLADNTTCDGGWGTCQTGSCVAVPASPFPYSPSNFNPALFAAAGAVVINCAVVFDSNGGAVSPNWCGGPAPALHVVTMDGGTTARLIAAQSLLVTSSGSLSLRGQMPVIIASYSTGQTLIDGDISAASDGNLDAGAGSRSAAQCGSQAGGGSVNPDHGGGGGGYGTPGAAGANLGAAGDAGPTWPEPLLGGCPGGNCTSGAQGGAGGGAVQISVAGELRLGSGGVTVSGGGGRGGLTGGSPPRGAGGGGSGGVILLEGNSLELTSSGHLTSNGGAGGEGSDADESGGNGQNGSEPGSAFATSPNLANQGGNGGRGGTRTGLPQVGQSATTNGGSGGAVGRIFIRSHTATCNVALTSTAVSPQYQVIGPNCPASP
jgi:Putative metal-binding motif